MKLIIEKQLFTFASLSFLLAFSGSCLAVNTCDIGGKKVKTSLSCDDYLRHFGDRSAVMPNNPKPYQPPQVEVERKKTNSKWLDDWEAKQRAKRQRAKERGEASRKKLAIEGKLQQMAVMKEVAVGMNKQQVNWAWGEPDRVTYRGTTEVWRYRRYKGKNYIGTDHVYFENGVVSGFDFDKS
ncbi:hypothetical protein [Neptunomonas marina]|uniref:DUF2845 domain-containing protein n=1 Tax=Neptunomonas marina TaxID=1815562 RepID=A0A437Q437_9GAMM|nr:hypothetical protein [Neptunomonas marina]RVU29289.1 hypothetical protein EOE65_16825 [Neptunomonas marina]